ncbi:Os06g0470075, partial [Oryza sativa Japonica Group]
LLLFLQFVERLEQERLESCHIHRDVLLHDDLGERRPALRVDGHGVLEHVVVPWVLVLERRLLLRDVILDVPEPHVARRLPVEVCGHPVHLAPRHDLYEHGARWEEDLVCQPGAVHRQQHVRRVHLLGEPAHVRAGLRHGHRKPEVLAERGHVAQVEQLAGALPLDHQHLGLSAGLVAQHRRAVPRQAERAAEEPVVVDHGVVARVSRRVRGDDEVAVAVQPEVAAPEAVHLVVLVEVDHPVVGELLQERRELVHPPRLEVGDEELHLAGEVRRR